MSNVKETVKAPCGYDAINARGQPYVKYPDVDCLYDCFNCDWNPLEHKRRMENGTFEENNGVWTLNITRRKV